MKLSVLIAVYHKECPEFLRHALDSLDAQIVRADEIVVVKDGPLGDDLDATVNSYRGRLPITALQLNENVGLGVALRAGLNQCGGELIARMDSDDICLPDRLEKQLKFPEQNREVDLMGGAIAAFDSDWTKIDSVPRTPSSAVPLHGV